MRSRTAKSVQEDQPFDLDLHSSLNESIVTNHRLKVNDTAHLVPLTVGKDVHRFCCKMTN